jgi:selenocysteine lyase/cysteine desulfurase
MGFNKGATAAEVPLWSQYRDQFPVTERLIYLNHAAVAPLCKPASDAMKSLADDVCSFGSFHYPEWVAAYDGLRDAAARLIHSRKDEIALVKNTSEGIATIALGIDFRPGDRIVGFQEEFPANFYPWQRLESKGVKVEWLSTSDPLDRIDEACRGARLLAISFVQYLSGFRADLNAIGEICKRRGCFFFVDAIQGMGAFPIDVNKAQIDALAADGHKWMLGPEGCGILYVRKERQDEIEPVEFGYTNAKAGDYSVRDMTLRADAGRYEPGTLNTIGIFGLRAALQFILDVGVERVGQQIQSTADHIANGAVSKGYELLGVRTQESSAGIVSFRKSGQDSRMLFNKLMGEKVLVASRAGWVRTSPHFYISPDEVERFVTLLP